MKNKESRTETIRFRVTPTEAEKIFKCATESEMLLADYLRRVTLKGITFRVEEKTLLEVESIDIRKVGEAGEKLRKHGAG